MSRLRSTMYMTCILYVLSRFITRADDDDDYGDDDDDDDDDASDGVMVERGNSIKS